MKRKDIVNYLNKWITLIIRLILIITILQNIVTKQFNNIGILVVTLIITFYACIIKKAVNIQIPKILQIFIILFIFGAQYLGTILDWYGKFYWWDTMLHTLSGVLFFMLGTFLIQDVNKKVSHHRVNTYIVILFGIFFSLGIGVIWELFEFIVDTFGGNMQRTFGEYGRGAIIDTMLDLISAAIGTGIISSIAFIKVKRLEKKRKKGRYK